MAASTAVPPGPRIETDGQKIRTSKAANAKPDVSARRSITDSRRGVVTAPDCTAAIGGSMRRLLQGGHPILADCGTGCRFEVAHATCVCLPGACKAVGLKRHFLECLNDRIAQANDPASRYRR